VQADGALAGIARLMRRFHDASRAFDGSHSTWSSEMADPRGGPVICHNDVCLENVVFRHGEAVAILDFDFAAPGRPVVDLAHCARMCVPVDDDVNAARQGWTGPDRPRRLRLVADAYGLDEDGRRELVDTVGATIARGGEFVRRRVAAGDPNFVKMWNEMGGEQRFDRRRHWWEEHREEFVDALE
jgi:thiamine kinase-like enzyme